jgi:hypothetical protein
VRVRCCIVWGYRSGDILSFSRFQVCTLWHAILCTYLLYQKSVVRFKDEGAVVAQNPSQVYENEEEHIPFACSEIAAPVLSHRLGLGDRCVSWVPHFATDAGCDVPHCPVRRRCDLVPGNFAQALSPQILVGPPSVVW